MPRVIFWNVNKKDLTSLVCSIAKSNDADVVVLNENKVSIAVMLQALRTNVSQDFYCPNSTPSSEERFHCFCRNSGLDLSEVHALQRSSVRKINIGPHKVLLALVHGVDMRNYDTEARQSSLQTLMTDMEFVKEQQKTNKLILLRDFNMNPYDKGRPNSSTASDHFPILVTFCGE